MKKITLLLSFVACIVFAQAQTTLFSENFDNVTTTATADPNGNIAGSKDLASILKLDSAIVTNPGWTGVKVYASNNRLKIGTSSAMGNLTTAPIDLSSNSFIISVDLASWNNIGNVADTGSSIDIQIDGIVVATIPYTTTMTNYTTPAISAKTATSKITFAAKVAKNRFYIDNVSVTTTTGLSTPSVDMLNVTVAGKTLTIANASTSTVEIFSTLGAKVQTTELVNGSAELNLAKGLYIVRIGNKSAKVRL